MFPTESPGRDAACEEAQAELFARLSVVRREEWAAEPPRVDELLSEPDKQRITVHHSAVDSKPHPLLGFGHTVRGIQTSHRDDRGWADVGYHFLIDPEGVLYEGRYLYTRGSHAGSQGANTDNVGICLIGNFETKVPPDPQLHALRDLVTELETHFCIERKRLTTHAAVKAEFGLGGTACPGEKLREIVEEWAVE